MAQNPNQRSNDKFIQGLILVGILAVFLLIVFFVALIIKTPSFAPPTQPPAPAAMQKEQTKTITTKPAKAPLSAPKPHHPQPVKTSHQQQSQHKSSHAANTHPKPMVDGI